jgi:hypothetical protein
MLLLRSSNYFLEAANLKFTSKFIAQLSKKSRTCFLFEMIYQKILDLNLVSTTLFSTLSLRLTQLNFNAKSEIYYKSE